MYVFLHTRYAADDGNEIDIFSIFTDEEKGDHHSYGTSVVYTRAPSDNANPLHLTQFPTGAMFGVLLGNCPSGCPEGATDRGVPFLVSNQPIEGLIARPSHAPAENCPLLGLWSSTVTTADRGGGNLGGSTFPIATFTAQCVSIYSSSAAGPPFQLFATKHGTITSFAQSPDGRAIAFTNNRVRSRFAP
jgi:hypothetical protein